MKGQPKQQRDAQCCTALHKSPGLPRTWHSSDTRPPHWTLRLGYRAGHRASYALAPSTVRRMQRISVYIRSAVGYPEPP